MTTYIGSIKKVSAGIGGEVLLITGSEKTAVYDAGMAFWGRRLAVNIKKELLGRQLDYVLLSHTHYDHSGGIPYLRQEWPSLLVFGASHGKDVLERQSTLDAIRRLSNDAAKSFLGQDCADVDYDDKDLKIDRVVGDGDQISLGDRRISVYNTKGHTNCSLSFYIEEDSILLASESTGVYVGNGEVIPALLTSYRDVMASIEKCRNLNAKYIFSPHSLLVERQDTGVYWELCKAAAYEFKENTLRLHDNGIPLEEIVEAHKQHWWVEYCRKEQPETAFEMNARAGVDAVLKEFR